MNSLSLKYYNIPSQHNMESDNHANTYIYFIPMEYLDIHITLVSNHVFGKWEKAGAPRDNPHMKVENMQTP